MRDYAKTVNRLRNWPRICAEYKNSVDELHDDAADTIEELLAIKTTDHTDTINALHEDVSEALALVSERETRINELAARNKELLAELERYRHAAFVIGETCVDESKRHISPEDAIKKIRENIYYSRQMPLPEPPKGVE